MTGPVTVDGPVSDAHFGVVTAEHPVLYRDVEVLCWTERKETVTERRGDMERKLDKYHYKCEWVSNFVDSRSFKDQKYNHNVRPNVHSERIGGGQIRVGDYQVNQGDIESAFGLRKLTDLFKHGQCNVANDREGIWQHDSRNSCLVRQRNPGRDTVGDVKVSYRVINLGPRATVLGIPNGNRLDRWSSLSTSVMAGIVDKMTFLQQKTK